MTRSALPLSLLCAAAALLVGSTLAGCADSGSSPPPPPGPTDTGLDTTSDTNDPDSGPTCDLPQGGACIDDDVHICNNQGGVTVTDCDEIFPDSFCRIRSSAAVCVVAEGEVCVVPNPDGPGNLFASCDGTNPGCSDPLDDDPVCKSGLGTCTTSQINSCRFGELIVGCLAGQPRTWDCTTMGGDCSNQRCIDLPEGAPCDVRANNPTAGRLRCATGLTCDIAASAQRGRCVVGD